MPSKKTRVIEILFEDPSRWAGDILVRDTVSFDEVVQAISQRNLELGPDEYRLSTGNPANFIKDFVRNGASFSRNWPSSVLSSGYSAVPEKGDKLCFRFVPIGGSESDDRTRLPSVYPQVPNNITIDVVQTLSIDLLNKALARTDENWLQVLANSLHIPHQHFARHPVEGRQLLHVGHIQSNVKLRRAELDGLYLARMGDGTVGLISAEVKGPNDDILLSQIAQQIEALRRLRQLITLFRSLGVEKGDAIIIPFAIKLVKVDKLQDAVREQVVPSGAKAVIYSLSFDPVSFGEQDKPDLKVHGESIFILQPSIKGVTG